MDLFHIIFNAISPYMFDILKLALTVTLFSNAIKIIRARTGNMSGSSSMNNPYSGMVTAFIGYSFGRGIPVIIQIVDKICNDILKHM